MGARHSKSIELYCQRTICFRATEFFPRCALIKVSRGSSKYSAYGALSLQDCLPQRFNTAATGV